MKNMPAGWYRNLDDRRQHGYWDGTAWIDPVDVESPEVVDPDAAEDDSAANE